MKVKALIISTVEFSQNGISAVIMNYFRGMKNQNILFDLFIPSDIVVDSRTKEIEQAGGTVYSYPRKKNPIGYWFYLRNLIQNNHYDIVHVHGNSATMDIELSAAKAAGTNVRIAHCHNTSTNHPVVHRLLRKKAMADATAYFACSNAAGKWFFEDKKFTVITNGIDTEKYRFNEESRKQIRKKLGFSDEDFVIGHVGLFNRQKNHSFLIDVAAKLIDKDKSYQFVFISEGPLMEDVKQKAEDLGINKNIKFVGVTDHVEDYLQAMDAFAFPSLFEGLGLALVEAQASGLGCFASDAVPKEANVTDGVTYLPIDDPSVWAETISNYRQHNRYSGEKRTAASDHSIKMITLKGYDIQTNADHLAGTYKIMVKKAGKNI